MEDETNEQSSRFETIIAILIAIVTVTGAIVAWRASVAADGAGDADYAGLRALVSAERTRALNYVNAYEDYTAFTGYKRYQDLADQIEKDLERLPTDDPQKAALETELSNVSDLARASRTLIEGRFVNRTGQYDLQRQLGEMWATEAKQKDLDPDPQFAEAEQLRSKTNWLLASVMVLGVGLVFYTLVESAASRLKYALAALGTLFLVLGAVMAVLIDTGKLAL
jgi:hypothetical protein